MKFKNNSKNIKYTTIVLAIILALLLPSFNFLMVAAEEKTYSNITADEAYQMIRKSIQHHTDLVILDVRTEFEFSSNHLYDAQLIPYDEIESRILELENFKNCRIVVYCKSGGRSQIASELLGKSGFSRIYNIIGGIEAWIDNGFPIWSVSHRVNVEKLNNFIIEPIIPNPSLDCGCDCSDGSEEGSCSDVTNIETAIIEENDDHTIASTFIEINEVIFNITSKITYILNYIETSDNFNRTLQFNLVEVISDDIALKEYILTYEVNHDKYNMKVLTRLIPLNFDSYDIATTTVLYTTQEKSLNTLEIFNFNGLQISLSELYYIIGKASDKLKKIYLKSFRLTDDEGFKQLFKNYNNIEKEMKKLSKIVSYKLSEYDDIIQENYANILDACDPVNYALCWLLVQGIQIYGCGIGTTLFCFLSGVVLGFIYTWVGSLWGLYCSLYYVILCSYPTYEIRLFYCQFYYGC